ncbi:conserved hypothetical protein [metagenome]|uniref:Cyclic nucleotide-binding domain-containing protein n=1 Tax=metagenome TaxID=256318 RepID=A0A2P2CD91_9ZZZZ
MGGFFPCPRGHHGGVRHIPAHAFPIEFRGIDCFRELAVSDVRRVWARGEHVHIPEGWSLIWETGPSDNVYLVLQGSLTLTSGQGVESTGGPGDVVGAIGSGVSQLMIVTTHSPVEALIMPAASFRAACAEVPAFASALGLSEPAVTSHSIDEQRGHSG